MWTLFKKLFGQPSPKENIDSAMKYLIVGLGNMHPDYNGTRHNVGFEVVDMIAKNKEASFKNDSLGDLCLVKHKGRHIHLLKPSTYMNRSGKSVNHWMSKLKIKPENVLVVVDDLNIEFGKLRLRGKGAAGGHNGLKDIEQVLGTSKYPRLRVGIGNDYSKGRQVDFVLGKWSDGEINQLGDILETSAKASLDFCSIGLSHTMNAYNK